MVCFRVYNCKYPAKDDSKDDDDDDDNVLENENFKLYWNCSILTDKTIPFNRPDITFMNKKQRTPF
jgi:hypothetical protein